MRRVADEKLATLLERLTVEYGIVLNDAQEYREALERI